MKALSFVIAIAYVFVAVCAFFTLFTPIYATFKVAAILGAVMSTPLAIKAWKEIQPAKKPAAPKE